MLSNESFLNPNAGTRSAEMTKTSTLGVRKRLVAHSFRPVFFGIAFFKSGAQPLRAHDASLSHKY